MARYQVWVEITSTETRKAVVEADSEDAAKAAVEAQAEAVDIFAATQDAGMYSDTEWAVTAVHSLDP